MARCLWRQLPNLDTPFCYWRGTCPSRWGCHFGRSAHYYSPNSPRNQDLYRICGNYNSCSFVYAKGVCEMDSQVPHTFPEERAGPVLEDDFGDMPRRWVIVFQKTGYTGWNLGLSLWFRHQSPVHAVEALGLTTSNEYKGAALPGQLSSGKVMHTVFWGQDGVVITDFLAKGTTTSGAYYASLLRKLRKAIKIERRGRITKGNLLLQ